MKNKRKIDHDIKLTKKESKNLDKLLKNPPKLKDKLVNLFKRKGVRYE